MNRPELQQLAEDRILDAQTLLTAGRWSGAYYLTGYAVECALKSCVLSRIIQTGVIFQEGNKKFSENCWTHNLKSLVGLADLTVTLDQACQADPVFGVNWNTARDWNESSRYKQITQAEAESLFIAVTDAQSGVMPWIRLHW